MPKATGHRAQIMSAYPGVQAYMRGGIERWRYRVNGRDVQLPLPPGGHAFVAAYEAAKMGVETPKANSHLRGSLGELVARFLSSPDHRDLSRLTRKDHLSILNWVLEARGANGKKWADVAVASMKPAHVKKLMGLKLSQAPAGKTNATAANKIKKMTGVIFEFAIREGLAQSNPAKPIRREKTSATGYEMWPSEQVEKFRDHYPSGTRERLILELAIATGLSRVDLCKASRANIDGQFFTYKRTKTGVAGAFPVLPNLQAELDQIPRGQFLLLQTEQGKAFTPEGLGNLFQKIRKRAKIDPSLSLHGLRKRGAADLAEAGATVPQIQAFLRDTSPAMASLYTAQADERKLGLGAVALLSR